MTVSTTREERFWSRVASRNEGECWLWTGAVGRGGYGLFHGEKFEPAHRWSYKYFIGPIPQGLQIDHLCRVHACVNPAHLEPVTQQENIRRGCIARGLDLKSHERRAAKPGHIPWQNRTHCPKQHPYDEVNTYWIHKAGSNPKRDCRTCRKDASDRYYQRRKTAQPS